MSWPTARRGIGSVATVIGARATVRLAIALYLLAGVLLLFAGWPGALAARARAARTRSTPRRWWNVDDESAPTANRGWRRFLWLNFVTGFLVTMLLIAYVLTR